MQLITAMILQFGWEAMNFWAVLECCFVWFKVADLPANFKNMLVKIELSYEWNCRLDLQTAAIITTKSMYGSMKQIRCRCISAKINIKFKLFFDISSSIIQDCISHLIHVKLQYEVDDKTQDSLCLARTMVFIPSSHDPFYRTGQRCKHVSIHCIWMEDDWYRL